jgi:manganese efflux pump family protein
VTASVAASVLLATPLGTDSAALCAGIGARERLSLRRRLTIAGTLTVFEAGMPGVGVLLSGVVGDAFGDAARICGGILLAVFGIYLLRSSHDDGDDHAAPVGVGALLVAGFAVSIDEVAVGVSLGLSGIDLPVLVGTIVVIVFGATMAGLTLGGMLTRHADRAVTVAGWLLVLLGILIVLDLL